MAATKIWLKQPDETARAYRGFCVFRDLPINERSYRKAHDILYTNGKNNLRTVHRWGSDFNWQARAAAYDDYVQSQQLDTKDEERKKLLEDELKDLKDLRGIWREGVKNFRIRQNKVQADIQDPNNPERTIRIIETSLSVHNFRMMVNSYIDIMKGLRLTLNMQTAPINFDNMFDAGDEAPNIIEFVWTEDASDNSGFDQDNLVS